MCALIAMLKHVAHSEENGSILVPFVLCNLALLLSTSQIRGIQRTKCGLKVGAWSLIFGNIVFIENDNMLCML